MAAVGMPWRTHYDLRAALGIGPRRRRGLSKDRDAADKSRIVKGLDFGADRDVDMGGWAGRVRRGALPDRTDRRRNLAAGGLGVEHGLERRARSPPIRPVMWLG